MSWVGLELGCRRVCSIDVVCLMKDWGFSRGEGAELLSGHESVKPAGSFEGWTRKLKDVAPEWMLQKWSVTSLEEKRW